MSSFSLLITQAFPYLSLHSTLFLGRQFSGVFKQMIECLMILNQLGTISGELLGSQAHCVCACCAVKSASTVWHDPECAGCEGGMSKGKGNLLLFIA